MSNHRGSTWNKWDFHVHTPYSLLNNGFGFNPFEDDDCLFDGYVKKLFSNAIKNEIAAIGVTDYFSIEGYKRIKNDYLNNDLKLKELFPNEAERKRVQEILVFPNIEFRLNIFIGDKSKSVNYHVIFSDLVPADIIEENFLNRISIQHNAGSTLPLTHSSIETIGKEYKEHNEEKGSDYLVGLKKIVVSDVSIRKALSESNLLQGQFFIAIPVDEDLSKVSWDGRDYSVRKNLYQQSSFLLTSNRKTREWALAKGREQEQIEEFKSIKPCIWGSDAHNYDILFCPKDNNNCWVKAEPSFEGLKQLLYEPEDRVTIQKESPEHVDYHYQIDYIQFDDSDFQIEPIYFSSGLTAIIGGKSTGKSTLLRQVANCIDPEQVKKREQKVFPEKDQLFVNAEVIWRDGVSGNRKIIYIPQSWLNRIVDIHDGESELNSIIKEILFQQEEVLKEHKTLLGKKHVITDNVRQSIKEYILEVENVKECEKQLSELGRSEAFEATIKSLEQNRRFLSVEFGLNEEAIQRYSELETKQAELDELLIETQDELDFLGQLDTPIAYIKELTYFDNSGICSYKFDRAKTTKDELQKLLSNINDNIAECWKENIKQLIEKKEITKEEYSNEKEKTIKEIEPIQQSMEINERLSQIDELLQEEKDNYRRALALEKKKEDSLKRAANLKNAILSSRKELESAYGIYEEIIKKYSSDNTELEFDVSVEFKKRAFTDTIGSLFDNRTYRSFKEKYKYNLADAEELIIDDNLFTSLWDAVECGVLTIKGGNDLEYVLEKIFSDWNHIHYLVQSESDTFEMMSPGKKALVLLELLISLEKGNCPILIDQPEDDLDNRSIYEDLVKYLKQKKRERQIIVVTHNANVVIAADAEEVIIANQDGKETKNHERRFEYRSGAIEDNEPVYDCEGVVRSGILNGKGIQDQICDILEGGKMAFELRRKKYSSLVVE